MNTVLHCVPVSGIGYWYKLDPVILGIG